MLFACFTNYLYRIRSIRIT